MALTPLHAGRLKSYEEVQKEKDSKILRSTVRIQNAYRSLDLPKTSISHPINISWIVPGKYLPYLSISELPDDLDLFDLTDPVLEQELAPRLTNIQQDVAGKSSSIPIMGNLALSSCPGKKVRLTGASRGRAAINRDLDLDMERMRSFGITTLVCCLSDQELEYLGAPWPLYTAAAARNDMEIIRLPMVEGSCPDSLAEIDDVIEYINRVIQKGENVLVHCRGGVGRAGLLACCWLLNNLFCLSAERAIRYVRIRRSPKAIETMRQAEFVIHYSQYIGQLLQLSKEPLLPVPLLLLQPEENETTVAEGDVATKDKAISVPHQDRPVEQHKQRQEQQQQQQRKLHMAHTDYTLSVPSMNAISNLERAMRDRDLIGDN